MTEGVPLTQGAADRTWLSGRAGKWVCGAGSRWSSGIECAREKKSRGRVLGRFVLVRVGRVVVFLVLFGFGFGFRFEPGLGFSPFHGH